MFAIPHLNDTVKHHIDSSKIIIGIFCMASNSKVPTSFSCFSNMFSWQTYNALFILRCATKFFVENLKEEDLVRQFEARPPPQPDGMLMVLLMSYCEAYPESKYHLAIKNYT
jgi:hypothetical protein